MNQARGGELRLSMSIQWGNRIPIPSPITRFPALGPARGHAGVYRVVASRRLARLRGEDDTLYIGSAARLAQRLSENHGVLPKLRELEEHLPGVTYALQVHDIAPEQAPNGLTPEMWARLLETAALNAYAAQYLELPPLNSRSEGFIAGRAMLAIAEALVPHKLGIAGFLAPTDEEASVLTYLPLALRKGQKRQAQMPQLLWTWPESWWGDEEPWWRDTKSFNRKNPRLTADTLYACAPAGNPLEKHIAGEAEPYDFADEGGKWWILALTNEGWREHGLVSSELETLRNAISEPISRLRWPKKA